jgi:cytochrome b
LGIRLSRHPLRSRRTVEICIDVALLLVLLLLFSPRLTGLPAHEWLGMALAVPLIVHLALSWSWISSSTARLAGSSTTRSRVNYILNWMLFALVVVEITSGIAISQVALPAVGILAINDRAWRALHNLALNWTLLLIGLHLAMNWTKFARGVLNSLRPWAKRP